MSGSEGNSVLVQAEDAVSLRYVNELDDHLYAQKRLYGLGKLAKIDKVVAVFLALFGVALIVTAGIHWWTMVWFPLAVVEWFNLLSISGLRTRYYFRNDPKYREEYRLTFSDTDIHFQTASIDSHIQWTHYNHAIETARVYLLCYGKAAYTVIPKSAFLSAEQENRFRQLLQRYIAAYQTTAN